MTFRELRKERGLTLEALAYLSKVDESTVSRIERGLVAPRPETAVALARALGIRVSRLLEALGAEAVK